MEAFSLFSNCLYPFKCSLKCYHFYFTCQRCLLAPPAHQVSFSGHLVHTLLNLKPETLFGICSFSTSIYSIVTKPINVPINNVCIVFLSSWTVCISIDLFISTTTNCCFFSHLLSQKMLDSVQWIFLVCRQFRGEIKGWVKKARSDSAWGH